MHSTLKILTCIWMSRPERWASNFVLVVITINIIITISKNNLFALLQLFMSFLYTWNSYLGMADCNVLLISQQSFSELSKRRRPAQ